MKEDETYQTQLRLNLRQPEHKEAYEYLQHRPRGLSISAYVVTALLYYKQQKGKSGLTGSMENKALYELPDLEKVLRKVIKEELHGTVTASSSGYVEDHYDEVEKTEEPEAVSEPVFREDTLSDLEDLLGY
ncbi:MAG: hypothetical protein H2212_03685 [Ruminococcus sp.]|nr:hypothetical protein [Ruminococcus sp.]